MTETGKLLVVIAVLVMGTAWTRPQPQALRASTELSETALDSRWDSGYEEDLLEDIAETFRHNEGMQRAVVDVLRGFREDELRLLERLLGTGTEDRPQADMPLEDLVDDGPQEIDGTEEFQGGPVVLDSVNSTSTETPSNTTHLHKISRENAVDMEERLKEMRLETIKNQIMNILWSSRSPPIMGFNVSSQIVPSSAPGQHNLLRVIADKINTQSHTPTDLYTEKIQSFYPSCEIPRNTDEDLWYNSQSMNLLFDLTYPTSQQGTQISIVAAKLRLYKLSQGNATTNTEICPPGEPSQTTITEEKMVRVSVYWYTRSLKKHRVRRRLLDSQMLSIYGNLWTEWNIKGAVKSWRENRNFGLAIEVENEDGTVLQANKFFSPMNCSEEASTSRPIPGFLVARALTPDNITDNTAEQGLHLDTFLFPMIDLCTVEFPESENPGTVFYHRIAEDPQSKTKKTGPSSGNPEHNQPPTNDTAHRIRHKGTDDTNKQPHRHLETIRRDNGDSIEEITWADDLDGHQIRKQIIVQKTVPKPHNDEQDNDR